MKKKSTIFIVGLLMVGSLSAQVGINTEDPQAALDVNGDLRVRTVLADNTSSRVLVLDANNVVRENTTIGGASSLKSFVSGTGGTNIILDVTLLTGWQKITFTNELFDENNDFNNINTYEFTAPQAGIYNIYAQFETSSLVTAGEVGIAIFKRAAGASTYTIEAQESYLNVSISVLGVGVGVSPPTRKVQKLLKLAAGDVITFGARVPVATVTLVGGSKSFFSINQVK